MIAVSFLLLFFGVYTLFSSSDVLDLARALFRIAIVLVLIVCNRFSDASAYEGFFLGFVIFVLALLAFVRMEVQVNHDRN